MSVDKSAGGINFYKSAGVQVFRNKPTLPEDYVPTQAQLSQRSSYAAARRLIRGSTAMLWLKKCGWNRRPRTGQASPYNLLMRNIVGPSTRSPDGSVLPATEIANRRSLLASDPTRYFNHYCALSETWLPTMNASEYEVNQDGTGYFVLSRSIWLDALRKLGKRSQDFGDGSDLTLLPALVVMISGVQISENIPFNVFAGSLDVQGNVRFEVSGFPAYASFYTYAFFFPRANGEYIGDFVAGEMSTSVPYFIIDPGGSPEPPGPAVVIERISINGQNLPIGNRLTVYGGEQMVVYGKGLTLDNVLCNDLFESNVPFRQWHDNLSIYEDRISGRVVTTHTSYAIPQVVAP